MDEASVQQYEDMYDPEGGLATEERSADSDARMFGFYIWNNVSIAFRTFASGLAFGVGTIFRITEEGDFSTLYSFEADSIHTPCSIHGGRRFAAS